MSPLVSICIPCHNNEEWIGSAIDSALQQSHEKVEVLVVDDASSDASAQVISRYGGTIKILQGEGRGGSAARNLAWQHAKGDWVQFLDGDDYLDPEKLTSNLGVVTAETDVVYSPILEENWKSGHPSERTAVVYHPDEDISLRWLRWKLCQTGGLLWRREALEKIDGWNPSMPHCQDNEICLRALEAGLQFTLDDSPNAIYRIHSEGTVCRKDPNAVVKTKMNLLISHLDWLEKGGLGLKVHHDAVGQALLEGARSMARSDLTAACALLKQHKKTISPRLCGPAAPRSYRLAYRILGFRAAERIAHLRREG